MDCKCYRYEPDSETMKADIMTGGNGEGWVVTQDCPIHCKPTFKLNGKTYRVLWTSFDEKYLSAGEVEG